MLLTGAELGRLNALAASRRGASPGAPGGHRPGPRKGEGSDFAGHRPYVAGDDPRLIDWNVYGRTGALHVKEFQEEVEASLAALVDLSGSMDSGGKGRQARRVAAAAATVALLLGDRARVAGFSAGRAGEARAFASAQEAAELDRHLEGLPGGGGPAGLEAARALLGSRRARVLFVSDLMEEASPAPALIALRERGHAVTVAQVLSREEVAPPRGWLRLRDAESGEERDVLVDDEAAAAYGRALEESLGGWQGVCASHGIRYVRILADQPLTDWADSVC